MTTKAFEVNNSKNTSVDAIYPRRGESNVALRPIIFRTDGEVACTPDLSETGQAGLLWPGQEVRVAERTVDAVVVKSSRRIKPGTRTDLQLLGEGRTLSGAIEWCRVTRLEPLCFEAAFVFDQSQELPETNHV